MRKLKFSLYVTLLSLLFINCKTSVDTMISDYNQNFETPTSSKSDESSLLPGDMNFDQNQMLKNEYYIYEDASFVVSGPASCSSYEWIIIDVSDTNQTPIAVVTRPGSSLTSKNFAIYVPESGLETGHTYKLTLTVMSGGKAYKDSCGLIIYKHYTY